MPENLRITAPISTEEGVAKPGSAPGTQRPFPVDPNRVPQAGGERKADGRAADLLLSRESVFGEFIRQLGQTPGLARTLQRIASLAAARPQQAGEILPPPDGASPLGQLAAGMPAGKGEILEDLAFQQENATLFGGPLFRFLDGLSARSGDPQLDLRIADFLKAFSGYFSAADTKRSVGYNLRDVEAAVPAAYARQIREAAAKLPPQDGTPPEVYAAAVKKQILPLLSRYVTRTNDYGKARDAISMLVNNLAILETSSRRGLFAKFSELLRYCRSGLNLPDAEAGDLQSFFAREILSRQSEPENGFFKSLLTLLSRAEKPSGKEGGPDPAALRDVCTSLLLDHSVFMPFNHLFLPIHIGGRFLFTEIWVEKKDPEARPARQGAEEGAPSRVYLTFDIRNLGYFEASVSLRGKRADLSLSFPPALARRRGEIRAELTGILERNGLTPGSVRAEPCGEPQVPKKILEKIYERKRTVDVSV